MHKIEYDIDGEGLRGYECELDTWMGVLSEHDYETIAENISLWHAQRNLAYDSFPCDMELIIDGESVGTFSIELRPVPEFTAKRVKND
ncbi:hypothetical protein [Orbus mooreae]|uniref:hypothetical protein n=1 Tax=Orbus mooreae TaxID=3074107 RepID=UPI00370DE0D0